MHLSGVNSVDKHRMWFLMGLFVSFRVWGAGGRGGGDPRWEGKERKANGHSVGGFHFPLLHGGGFGP